MAAVAVNPLLETHTLGAFSSLFNTFSPTKDAFRTLRELGWRFRVWTAEREAEYEQ